MRNAGLKQIAYEPEPRWWYRPIPPIRKTRNIVCPKTIHFAGIVVTGMGYTETI